MDINNTIQTASVYLALFVDNCMYATDSKAVYVLRKLQRGLISIETWCKRLNIKINEDKTLAIYFFHRSKTSEFHLTLNGPNFPFVNHVKCLGVIVEKRTTWRLHTEMFRATTFRTVSRRLPTAAARVQTRV
jgi:hypothetical protein